MGWIILGGGGHGSVIGDILLSDGHSVDGFTDISPSPPLLGRIPYLGDDLVVLGMDRRDVCLANGIGSVGDPSLRRRIFEDFQGKGYDFPPVISKNAYISPFASLGQGTVIFPGAIIQTAVSIGINVIINTGAVVDHGCKIGNHVHIAPGAVLSGDVTVGDRSHIGTGASVIQGIEIGEGAIVAAGAVVVKNIKPNAMVWGIPAKEKSSG